MKFPALCFALLYSFQLIAQSNVPEKGKITDAELQMKDCAFDPDANAVILFDDAFVDYGDEGRMVMTRRVRLKILNDKGIESGNILIPYYSYDNIEMIHKVEGYTFNPDGSGKVVGTALDKKTIFNQKQNKYYSEIKFAMPAVRAGSIIEYQYELVKKWYDPRSWDFQSTLPVMRSCYLLQIPPDAEFTYSIQKKRNYRVDIKPIPTLGRVYFEMQNIPALRSEPYMDAAGDFVQRVILQFSGYLTFSGKKEVNSTWKQVALDLMRNKQFGSQLDRPLKSSEITIGPSASAHEKVETVYKYVRDNVSWDGFSGKYAERAVKDVLEKKKGDAGDMNLLLVNLLRSYDLDALPMLVAERKYGRVDTTFPFLDRFNKVVAYVRTPERDYILDATQRYNPATLTPLSLLNTTGFIVDKKNYAFLRIGNGKATAKNKIYVEATLAAGKLTGNVHVTSVDYARVERMDHLKYNQSSFVDKYFDSPAEGFVIDSFNFKNVEDETLPLEQNVKFSQTLIENAGFILLKYNLFTGLESNPFTSSIRFSDINFGYPTEFTVDFRVSLPAGAKIEELPKDQSLDHNGYGIKLTRMIKYENNELRIMLTFSQRATSIGVDYYADVKDFYKKMVNMLEEPVLIKLQ